MALALAERYVLPEMIYGTAEKTGLAFLIVAGCVSGFAALITLLAMALKSSKLGNIYVVPFFVSLLVANVVQALATTLSGKWVVLSAVENSAYCGFQGAIKNGGNVGMALWSFAISVHVFVLLFLRKDMSRRVSVVCVAAGWFLVLFVVAIGPIAIQRSSKGPYFGPSGYWCWITTMYPHEQFFMEYFFEFLSAGVSFVLYTLILLRVRGNLLFLDGKWSLRFVPRHERWQLALRRDVTDCHMMRVAARMVWHPVAYSIMIIPVTLARFYAFSGRPVPFWATVLSDFIFNLQGIVNVILLVSTRKLIPDAASLPIFVPRNVVDTSATHGVTPFMLERSWREEKPLPPAPVLQEDTQPAKEAPLRRSSSMYSDESALERSSVFSHTSADSQTPLVVC